MTKEECYQGLANAIIIQAAKDYRKAKEVLRRVPRHEGALKVKAEIERFFKSDWFKCLTDLDGEMLMRKLQKEA